MEYTVALYKLLYLDGDTIFAMVEFVRSTYARDKRKMILAIRDSIGSLSPPKLPLLQKRLLDILLISHQLVVSRESWTSDF